MPGHASVPAALMLLGGRGPSLFRRPIIVLAVVALVALVSTLIWDRPASTSHSTTAPSASAAQQTLTAQASAWLHHDRAAFAGTLDAGAVSYRDAQLAAFDNATAVPFAAWQLSIDAPVTSPELVQAASHRLGVSAAIYKVQLSYVLDAVDPVASVRSLWLTFVTRHSRVVVAADSDVAAEAGQSWQGPWDFGKVVVARGTSSLILAHPLAAAQLPALSHAVDAAVAAVAAVWNSGWNHKVAVIVPADQDEMDAVIGQNLVLDQIQAVSIADPSSAVTGVPAAGSALAQRIVLNPVNLARLSDVGEQIVLRHEVTLIATRPSAGSAMPTWLMEGFAEYVANLNSGQGVPFAASELATDVRAGRLPDALPTSADFGTENTDLPQIYEQSWLACKMIADTHGADVLISLFHSVADASSTGTSTDEAFDSAAHTVLGLSTAQFIANWQNYLRTQLS